MSHASSCHAPPHRTAPHSGPRILFFSGGTALREISRALTAWTHNSIHLITPFDSGGSSAVLRRAFGMPAVGDLRNRLLALTDPDHPCAAATAQLLAFRLPHDAPAHELHATLRALAEGSHPRIRQVPEPARTVLCQHLRSFAERIDARFDLRRASIGNLVLAAGYLDAGRDMDPIVTQCAGLLRAQGHVRLTANANAHLRARLRDGQVVIGQHRLTGKEAPPLEVPIAHLDLVDASGRPATIAIDDQGARCIHSADLICYPVGSFFTSVIANLLPQGVAEAIAAAHCPKIFIPNPLPDPETSRITLADQLRLLIRSACPPHIPAQHALNAVLLDPAVAYPGRAEAVSYARSLRVEVLGIPFTAPDGRADPQKLCRILVSLAQEGRTTTRCIAANVAH